MPLLLLDPLNTVRTSLIESHIIPDIIPASEPPFIPESLLVIMFPTGQEALLGNTLIKEEAATEPIIEFTPMQPPDEQEKLTYTFVMSDPDAPTRDDPVFAQWRHWVITGVKAPSTASAIESGSVAAQLTKSSIVTPYHPPSPPLGTGPHRYVFLLYEEPNAEFSIPDDAIERKNGSEGRKNWDAARFAEKYGLKLVAVNFFVVEGEEEEEVVEEEEEEEEVVFARSTTL